MKRNSVICKVSAIVVGLLVMVCQGCSASQSSDEAGLESLTSGGAAINPERRPAAPTSMPPADDPVSESASMQAMPASPADGVDAGTMMDADREQNRENGAGMTGSETGSTVSWLAIAIDQNDVSGPVGDERQLTVTGTGENDLSGPVNDAIDWRSANAEVATVDENGRLRLVGMGMTTITARIGADLSDEIMVTAQCDYPQNTGQFAFGEVVPPVVWNNAYRPDGTQYDFGLAQFFCAPNYSESRILVLMVGAGWCGPCSDYTKNVLNPIAEDLIMAGAEIVYIEAEDSQYQPAPSRFAFQHLRVLIGDGPGIRVGDADTFLMDENGQRRAAPSFVQEQSLLEAFPSVWVVRRRDMRLIADQNRSNFYLPLALIAADPERDWSAPPPPPFRSNCEEGEEEELTETRCEPLFVGVQCMSDEQCDAPAVCEQEMGRCTEGVCDGDCDLETSRCLNRNDSIYTAQTMIVGEDFAGGICNRAPDFYRIITRNRWRVTLEFSHDEGDLDLYLWDKDTDNIKIDENNRRLGSYGVDNVESFEGIGPAYISVLGYNSASANYTLRVEELME
ncbi:MAG: Ig-like domain-containing protein [Myxococcota bacterium]|nr:Ig-like domain-containing protein [Myxococcota bacterium]